MPRIVSELPELTVGAIAKPEKFPYDDYLDGRVWAFEVGDDLEMPKNFPSLVRNAAKRRGIKIATRTRGTTFYVQALLTTEN